MKQKLDELKTIAIEAIESAKSADELEALRVRFLGKKGELTTILKGLGRLSNEERPEMGKLSNEIKNLIAGGLEEKTVLLEKQQMEEKILKETIDITLPGRKYNIGRIHPLTAIMREIKEIFLSLGFGIVEGPEVETEYNNFEALNIPADHPSREMWDSFYFRRGLLMRSHTSPVQVRVMKEKQPPVKIIVPGKCYRRDTVDATHHWMFHQVEGLLVDERATFADLKGLLLQFAKRMFGEERKARFFPSYFPFTEPSADMSMDCFVCGGEGCRTCKNSGWIEILGAGMVNPNVLKAVGYDPEKYSGFAFGLGAERIAMLKYGIEDIRLFYENDQRFLEQI